MTENNTLWQNQKHIYLASADNILGIEAFFKKHFLRQCEHFYSVIGGLGGLNFIYYLDELKSITFFDVNSYTIDVLDLYLELISISKSLNEFVSNFFCRDFDFDLHKDNSFLSQNVNSAIVKNLNTTLSPKSWELFSLIYLPYIYNTNEPIVGPVYHLSKLLPFFDPESLNTQMTCAISQHHPHSINSLFVGRGWLTNNYTYLKTKNILANVTIHKLATSAENIDIQSNSGMYGSNIWNTDPSEKYSGYKTFIHKLNWLIGYDDYEHCNNYLEVQYYNKDIVEPKERFGENNGNPHDTCCMALDTIVDLNQNQFLEVIEPHPTEGMNYGFRFYRGQQRIKTSDYLTNTFNNKSIDIIIIHILLGAGVNLQDWLKIIHKANNEAKILIIAEHRKECADFKIREWDVFTENLIDEYNLDEYIYSLSSHFNKLACANLKGNSMDARNLIYFKK